MHTTLTTADGLQLHVRDWPAAGAHGTVLLVHGLGEHIGRYAHVAEHLNSWGWSAVGYDQRGHGRSPGAKGVLSQPDDLLRDLALAVEAVRRDRAGPLVLLGHSMGGLVAARYVAESTGPATPAPWYRAVDALVLSSPALALPMTGFQKGLLACLNALAPTLALNNGLKPAWLSRDAKVVAAYQADPLVHDRVSARLVQFMRDGAEWVHERAPHWRLPTLLLYAGSDRCVAPDGSRQFAQAAPQGVLTAQEFPAFFHEIFNEPEQDQAFGALAVWLAAR